MADGGWWWLLLLGSYVALGACAGKGRAAADSAAGRGGDPEANAATRHPPSGVRHATVLFIGTSLTAGLGLDPDSAYPQLVQQKIDSAGLPFEVVNAGVSGETSAGLLRRLDWLLRGDFGVVVVETGANDGLRGTPVAEATRNIRAVIQRIQQTHPHARVVLVQMEAPPNLGTSYTRAFHAMYPAIARETGATLMPFLLDRVAGVPSLNQGDGLHPNHLGEHIVADNVWRSLEPVLVAVSDSVSNARPRPAAAP